MTSEDGNDDHDDTDETNDDDEEHHEVDDDDKYDGDENTLHESIVNASMSCPLLYECSYHYLSLQDHLSIFESIFVLVAVLMSIREGCME